MTTPPSFPGALVCTSGVCLRTLVTLSLFTLALAGAPDHLGKARALAVEAQQTSNPIRLFLLAREIKSELDAAIAVNPDNVEARLDLVRFYVMAPRIAGGDLKAARNEVAEIARRDAARGAFARGYVAYRLKEYGVARIAVREAVRTGDAATRVLAMRWLGWLSQESQQWNDAFAIFGELGDAKEIARTEEFCRCKAP